MTGPAHADGAQNADGAAPGAPAQPLPGPDPGPDPGIAARLRAVSERVAAAASDAGRSPGEVRVLLATKTVPASRIIEAIDAGARLIGENRVQEVLAKYDELTGQPHQSHFIGHLQANKVNALLGRVSCLQTLDSAALAERLQRRLKVLDAHLDVMIQVNVSGEASKFGVPPSAAENLVTALAELPRLHLRGYMTIGLNSPDRVAVRAGYARLRDLRDDLAARGLPGAPGAGELSMGMSGDFPDAIAEGATIVRVGSAVFGQRPPAA
ncbi:MAG TPA: YggS family pyridoxal phosphate-dependent enzyme [Nakamurella sp.]|nr:YggS family pyridoxal phosphate-dependent enzyme [Nakamurella sp.]